MRWKNSVNIFLKFPVSGERSTRRPVFRALQRGFTEDGEEGAFQKDFYRRQRRKRRSNWVLSIKPFVIFVAFCKFCPALPARESFAGLSAIVSQPTSRCNSLADETPAHKADTPCATQNEVTGSLRETRESLREFPL